MKKRLPRNVEVDPTTGERHLKPVDEEKLEAYQYNANNSLVKLGQDYRTLVLFGSNATQLHDTQDPILQLALEARNRYNEAKNKPISGNADDDESFKAMTIAAANKQKEEQVYFQEMAKLLLQAKTTLTKGTESLLERLQKDKHHREKLELAKEKHDGEFTEADLENIVE